MCRPLAKQFQEAKAPLTYYCQARRQQQEDSMTAISLTLYPTRPAGDAPPEVTEPSIVELDDITEATACSCNASDDNPH